MHELALTQSIVEMVAEHSEGRRVRRVVVEIGKLACVTPYALQFCFDLVAEGTPLEGSMLEIREIEGRARCRSCGSEFSQETLWSACQCGACDTERLSGDELHVKEYELDAEVNA